ncbi:MAG: ISAzo13 family transposase, partial [Azonexus sp.]|nr:ISAzo13 family transposase [Azonexus sp.]
MEADELITARYVALESVLDERQRRLYAAVEAKVLGHGGVKRVHEATGVARGSILAGLKELEEGIEVVAGEPRRIRRAGAGRKTLIEQDPGVQEALERLVEPVTRGDPESPLRWTCKSLMQLSRE